MCIHLFAHDRLITIPFLMEQVHLTPNYETLSIEEVYDIVIRNDEIMHKNEKGEVSDKREITELWALYPHDIAVSETLHGVPSIHPNVERHRIGSKSDHVWYVLDTAKLEREHPDITVNKDVYDPDKKSLELTFAGCRRLHGQHADYPPEITVELLEHLRGIRRSLFRIKLDVPLLPGEQGVLRLRICPDPTRLSVSTRPNASPAVSDDVPRRYNWNLRIDSPSHLRLDTKRAFEAALAAQTSGKTSEDIQRLRNVFISHVRDQNGGSVRIENHRIAIVFPGAIDVTEQDKSQSVDAVGLTSFVDREGPREARVWLTGSNKNWEADVVHMVERVRDFVKNVNRSCDKDEIVRSLATADRHEALSTLVEEMEQANILRKEGLKYAWDGGMEDDAAWRAAVGRVRLKYDNAEKMVVDPGKKSLYLQFRNLHPFQIGYRVAWESFERGAEHSIARKRYKQWLWDVTVMVLSVLALVISIVTLFW